MRWVVLMLLAAMVGGCANYEFDVKEPAALKTHVGRAQSETIYLEPLTYEMRADEGRLVLMIHNPTDEAVRLLGQESFIVDPQGQSHLLRGQAIAPASFIKLILPPSRPVYRSGPTVGFGVIASRGGPDPIDRDPMMSQPRYLQVYDEGDSLYWDWDGETDIRLRLVYSTKARAFHHDFTIHRVKVG